MLRLTVIVAIDPGKNIGVAVVSDDGELIKSEIICIEDLKTYSFPENATVLIGNGTSSQKIIKLLDIQAILVDETNTSLIARDLYFKDNPAKGLGRLIPIGLRSPDRLIDDYAAYAIALRYLGKL
ncbi:MAG TPA: resolvase [Trueperaceae bacterium]|nr:resolvase [Trueperaceae bacterium]